jgi:flagellar biosynthesis protein FliR
MELLNTEYLLQVFLVFVRISGLLLVAPFFSQNSFSVRIRVLLAVVLAYAMTGLVGGDLPPFVMNGFGFMAAIGIEAFTGILLGFTAQFIFYAIQFAGEIIGYQMALGIAQIYDPLSGNSANPVGRLLSLTFMLVFVTINGHHVLLQALATSFEVVPIGGAVLQAGGPLLLDWTADFFTTAIRLAAPFMITILLIDVTLGVFARLVPQANLFMLSLPLKLSVGLVICYFFMQNLFPMVPSMIEEIQADLLRMIEALANG